MALVGRRNREGQYLVVRSGTSEVLAAYTTIEEQWYHLYQKYPPQSLREAKAAHSKYVRQQRENSERTVV